MELMGIMCRSKEDKAILSSKTTIVDIAPDGESIEISVSSKELDTIEEEKTVWHQIRKGLIEELGETIDTVWFSKAVAIECKGTKTLTLTMPIRFMADWVKNNYSHVIRKYVISSKNFKNIAYVYSI